MNCNHKNWLIFIFSLLVFLNCFAELFAKDNEISESGVKQGISVNEEDLTAEQQWQLIEWDNAKAEYILYYEIVIQSYDLKKNDYFDFVTLKTQDNSESIHVDPQLEPGNYRYKIIPYNLLGLKGQESSWVNFTIVEAYQPSITGISADVNNSDTIYLDEWNDGKFSVSGRNLFEGPETDRDTKYTTYELRKHKKTKSENGALSPIAIEHKNERNLNVTFDPSQLDVGIWNFIATDASGLESGSDNHSQITVKYRKWMDLDVSGGYVLPIILFDDTIPTYMNSSVWPLSIFGKITFLPFKRRFGNFGVGLSSSFSMMNAEFSRYKIDGNMITGFVNAVYQLPVFFKSRSSDTRRHRLTLELHGGIGCVYLMNYQFHFSNDINSRKLNAILPGLDAGAAIQVYITNRLYTELNADFVFAMGKDITLGTVLPGVAVGWQF